MKKKLMALVVLVAMALSACAPATPPEPSAQSEGTAETQVHFIDVGQGDSTLIISGDQAMLVDAGTNEAGDDVVEYIRSLGIEKLDYVIGTHPHEDHIGGLDDVITAFDTDVVIMPEKQTNTATFESVLDALMDKGQSLTAPVPGTTCVLGSCEFTIVAPVEDYGSNLNNWSVGIILTCDEVSFAFFGDAETAAEQDILDSGADIRADVLKVSHHGSDTSTGQDFLDAIDPEYGVISCGQDNSYGHPCQETLDKLAGVELRRTDLAGTVVASTDGKTISWSVPAVSPSEEQPQEQEEEQQGQTYALNTSSKKFHLPDCSAVGKIKSANLEMFTGTRQEVTDMGYDPCGICQP